MSGQQLTIHDCYQIIRLYSEITRDSFQMITIKQVSIVHVKL